MTSFEQLKAQLQGDSCALSTPCYIYSVSDVQRNYEDLKAALGTQLIYSFKANSNLDLIVRCGHIFTDGIELASQGELNLLATGEAPRYINNPSADKNFFRAAIASKARIIIDHPDQVEILAEFVGKRPIQPLVLRLNHCLLKEFDTRLNFRDNHFGMDWEGVQAAVQRCNELELDIAGVHLFTGSYQFEKYAMATAQASLHCVERLQQLLRYKLSFFNLGGGFDSSWRDSDFDFGQYRQLLSEFPEHITLAHESGRGIMASAGYFVSQVRYLKHIDERHYAVCDGGMAQNFLLAQTENTFRRYTTPIHVARDTEDTGPEKHYLVVGTSCNKDDVIGQLDTNGLKEGDYLVFEHCGAYNASYTVAPFLNLPKANTYIME